MEFSTDYRRSLASKEFSMFDPQAAFKRLNGRSFDFSKLTVELKKMRFQFIDELPPEFDTNELFLLALRSRWLKETDKGEVAHRGCLISSPLKSARVAAPQRFQRSMSEPRAEIVSTKRSR
jgi:hypothetical protein